MTLSDSETEELEGLNMGLFSSFFSLPFYLFAIAHLMYH